MADDDDFWAEMTPALMAGQSFVLATVVATSSSAPRPPGAHMAVLGDGLVIGSLSGGCVEADVVACAEEVAATGESLLRDYGYSEDTAFGVGLTCGGSIRVLLEQIRENELGFYRDLAAYVGAGIPVATITALGGPQRGQRELLSPHPGQIFGATLQQQARDMLGRQHSALSGAHFIRSYSGPEHLVIFGSNAFAAALCRLAKITGYRVTICDARATFTTPERFPDADDIVVQQPHKYLAELEVNQRTILCALTHDPKFDDPLLSAALRTPAQFIGAMGSRHTSQQRFTRLRHLGVSEADLARLHAPLGLDLGAHTPTETAVSMLAEIISARRGGSNRPLNQTKGRIHDSG